jgi:hypothetical protein
MKFADHTAKQVHFDPAFEEEDEERTRRRLLRQEEKKVGRENVRTLIATGSFIRLLLFFFFLLSVLLLLGALQMPRIREIRYRKSHFFFFCLHRDSERMKSKVSVCRFSLPGFDPLYTSARLTS